MPDVHALFLMWHPRVEALARQMLVDGDDSAEVAQDVFVEAWRKLAVYDSRRGSEWAWLRAMTHSRCLDRLRAAKRRTAIAWAAAQDEGPTEDIDCDVSSLVSSLPEAQRVPIELAYVSGFTHREIAVEIGVPLGTVKTRIRTGLARLASALAGRASELGFACGAASKAA